MAEASRPDAPERRVLVVDDSATVRRTASLLLERAGHRVVVAASGEEAFEICARDPAFDAIITDLTMGALGGVQLCRLLRSTPSTSTIPLVMLTAASHRRA